MKTRVAPFLCAAGWFAGCAAGWFAGCAGDAGDVATNNMLELLGSELVASADGTPERCTNFYAELDGDHHKPLNIDALPINRGAPCPGEGALGACELPLSASGERMQGEVVYYEVVYYEGAEFETLRDGDACSGSGGVWSKPYPKDTAGSNEGAGY